MCVCVCSACVLSPLFIIICCVLSMVVAEGAMKARREIADYMKNQRIERARIRVSCFACVHLEQCIIM